MKRVLSFLLSMTIIIGILPMTVTAEENAKCTKITAKYNTDGSLKEVNTEEINISDIIPVNNTSEEKIFYWDSLTGMEGMKKSL